MTAERLAEQVPSGAGHAEEEEPILRIARARLRELRAPESLRARIAAMIAVEERLGP